MADDRRAVRERGRRTFEGGVTEGEDATVGADEPVALARRASPRCATIGEIIAPGLAIEPWNPASPKAKTPPSEPTSQ